MLFEAMDHLGGQLVKQTHRFFGSEKEHAGTRGIDIAAMLSQRVTANPNIETFLEASALGFYRDDQILSIEFGEGILTCQAGAVVFATGASEKFLSFENNDLPGIYGAGAVQTLMNVHGILPGEKAVMVGAGNIGLIVSYQLMQAGVRVQAIVEGAERIGGYLVHASKVRRAGVPILTRHSILRAHGTEALEAVTVVELDSSWQPIPGTERTIEADILCLAVGLSPLVEMLWQAGCRMTYVPELGGHVPERNQWMETSVPGLYVAGDASSVEEASSAMVEGRLAGLSAAARFGYTHGVGERRQEALADLASLRSGPVGEKIRSGLARLAKGGKA